MCLNESTRNETTKYTIWDCGLTATTGDHPNPTGSGTRDMDVCSTILMDGAARDARHEALEAENERLRDTVRELKVKGGEHVCQLFTRVQAIENSIGDLSKRFGKRNCSPEYYGGSKRNKFCRGR